MLIHYTILSNKKTPFLVPVVLSQVGKPGRSTPKNIIQRLNAPAFFHVLTCNMETC